MPLQTIRLLPGVNTEKTPTQNQVAIQSSQLIRFKPAGDTVLVEKLGGWQKFYPLSVGSPIRELHAWEGINSDQYLGAGAEQSLSVIFNGALRDITPQTFTSDITPDFSTTSGSAVVEVVDTTFTTTTADSIYIVTPVAVGGLVLMGQYAITSVVNASTYRITAPVQATATVSHGGAVPLFTTVLSSSSVNVELVNNGYTVGALFAVPVPTSVGGITLSGSYVVQSIIDADHFTINAANAASSDDSASMNGGDVRILYYVAVVPPVVSRGYGIGGYGEGGYGGSTPTPSSGVPITTTNWTLDNWGEILLACPTNGAIYSWSIDSGVINATKVISAPNINGGIFVSEPAQILIAWGSSNNGVQDPLLINWSDSGDFTNWSVTSRTQAGGYRIPTGSKIVGGLQGPQFGFIWTDVDVWAMQYIQPPFVFGFNKLAQECGMISRHAACVVNSSVFWMGLNQFYTYAGAGVQPVLCSVWDFVFQDLDMENLDKIHVAPNNGFGEIAWYFPSKSGGTGEVDSYVKYNFLLQCWDCGRLKRTAWIDQSVLGQPIGATQSGLIYQHEVSMDADGQPMGESFATGYAQISEGENLMFVDWMIPDFKYGFYNGAQNASLNVTLNYVNYPSAVAGSKGPYVVNSSTDFRNPRVRAREVGFTIQGTGLNSFWRMGGLRYRAAPDGRR